MAARAHDYTRAERLASDPVVVGSALRAFFAISDRWGLKAAEARRLLGSPSESTYFSWKKKGVTGVSPDVLLRISYVISIAALLERLFAGAPERAHKWMTSPNKGPLTKGRTALEFALEGGLIALDELNGLLQSDVGGGAPVSTDAIVATPNRS
jgi:hypothetical protein